MTAALTNVIMQIQVYCQEVTPQSNISTDTLVEGVFSSLKNAAPLERWELVRKIRLEITKKSAQVAQVDALKRAFCKETKTNWKDRLLGAHFAPKLNIHIPYFQYLNKLEIPYDIDKRAKYFTESPFEACFGSTFATNIAKRIDDQSHHLLDAAFAVICLDQKGDFNGYAMAVSDGAGGHFSDPKQDKNIAYAAHMATKTCVRLFSAYEDPVKLLKAIPELMKLVDKEVQRAGVGESTTLVACKAFPSDNGFRVIGLNVGDGMLIAWDPAAQKLLHLLPARATTAGTALIPGVYKPFELYTLDVNLPIGCQLFMMTDGVHDSLPFEEVEAQYPNELSYRTRTLTQLEEQLKSSQRLPLKEIVQQMFAGIAHQRKNSLNTPDIKIGDDFTILQCTLSHS